MTVTQDVNKGVVRGVGVEPFTARRTVVVAD
jgi:hypothetical protein